MAGRNGVPECIEPLVDLHADIESKDSNNQTALSLAVWRWEQNCDSIKKLLGLGASTTFLVKPTEKAKNITKCLAKGTVFYF